jgi:hypothetical protein
MNDKTFLSLLNQGRIKWSRASLQQVKALRKKKLAEYKRLSGCGYWIVTEKGRKLI